MKCYKVKKVFLANLRLFVCGEGRGKTRVGLRGRSKKSYKHAEQSDGFFYLIWFEFVAYIELCGFSIEIEIENCGGNKQEF